MNKIRETLECPVCLETLQPPTHACLTGHTICDTCFNKLPSTKSCPLCRQPLNARSTLVEQILEHVLQACENRSSGCRVEMVPQKLAVHKKLCQWRKVTCFLKTCKSQVPLAEYHGHVLQQHQQHVVNVSAAGHVRFTCHPQQQVRDYVYFLRDEDLLNILPYHFNLTLDFASNEFRACLSSCKEQFKYEMSLTTSTDHSFSSSCTTKTVPAIHGDTTYWKKHRHCVKGGLYGANDEDVLDVSLNLKMSKEEHAHEMAKENMDRQCEILSSLLLKNTHLKYLEEHERVCKYRMMECVVDGCEKAVARRNLEEHVVTSHGDDVIALPHGGTCVSVKDLWGIATICHDPHHCSLKAQVMKKVQTQDYGLTRKPCIVPSCKELITDEALVQHTEQNHGIITNIQSELMGSVCRGSACLTTRMLGNLVKRHDLKCQAETGTCPLHSCRRQILTSVQEHLQTWHQDVTLPAPSWSLSIPVDIPLYGVNNVGIKTEYILPAGGNSSTSLIVSTTTFRRNLVVRIVYLQRHLYKIIIRVTSQIKSFDIQAAGTVVIPLEDEEEVQSLILTFESLLA